MAAFCLIEWRDPHQPMHPCLTRKQAECELAGDGKCRRLDACFIAILNLIQVRFEALALGQRMYMRISISAQSWLSVPPAPG